MRVLIPRYLSVGLILLALLVPSVAFAANDTPDGATPLSTATSSVSDSLVGSTGGAYRFYRFRYQGSSAPVLVSLTYQPAYGDGNQAFGFNIYGPSGLSFVGQVTGTSGTTGTAQYTVVNPAAMDLLVQVYNYTNGGPVSYTLTVSGLSGGSDTGVVAKDNSTPDKSVNVDTINASLGGTLVGNAAGAFHFYTLRYPGGNTPMTVTMNASPTYNGQGQAYGFNLYRTTPSGQSTLVASSSPIAQDVNSTTASATVTGRSAATYQLQVVNYWPGQSVSYGINVTGAAADPTPATGNTSSDHAIVLNSARQGATETLTGSGGGAFNFYLVNYPGSQSSLAISLTVDSLGGAQPGAVGFNVYDGASLVATVNPIDDGTGVQSAAWSYQNADPKTFGIQVFNYAAGAAVSYTIYQVGSQ